MPEANDSDEKQRAFKTVLETIRAVFDISESKKRIVDIIGKTLNADRCYIVEYDSFKEEFLYITEQYTSSEEISEYKGLNVNKELPAFVDIVKEGHPILVKNKQTLLKESEGKFEKELAVLEKYNIKSFYTFPLYYNKQLLGSLSVHYVKNEHFLTEDEINFLITITHRIAMAIHKGRLYQKIKLQAEREKIISEIVSTSLSTLDINQIKTILSKIGGL